jgi:hypothetical protein
VEPDATSITKSCHRLASSGWSRLERNEIMEPSGDRGAHARRDQREIHSVAGR